MTKGDYVRKVESYTLCVALRQREAVGYPVGRIAPAISMARQLLLEKITDHHMQFVAMILQKQRVGAATDYAQAFKRYIV